MSLATSSCEAPPSASTGGDVLERFHRLRGQAFEHGARLIDAVLSSHDEEVGAARQRALRERGAGEQGLWIEALDGHPLRLAQELQAGHRSAATDCHR